METRSALPLSKVFFLAKSYSCFIFHFSSVFNNPGSRPKFPSVTPNSPLEPPYFVTHRAPVHYPRLRSVLASIKGVDSHCTPPFLVLCLFLRSSFGLPSQNVVILFCAGFYPPAHCLFRLPPRLCLKSKCSRRLLHTLWGDRPLPQLLPLVPFFLYFFHLADSFLYTFAWPPNSCSCALFSPFPRYVYFRLCLYAFSLPTAFFQLPSFWLFTQRPPPHLLDWTTTWRFGKPRPDAPQISVSSALSPLWSFPCFFLHYAPVPRR